MLSSFLAVILRWNLNKSIYYLVLTVSKLLNCFLLKVVYRLDCTYSDARKSPSQHQLSTSPETYVFFKPMEQAAAVQTMEDGDSRR